MRFSSSVTSVSWIPSEAITGHTRLPMDLGLGRYDDPPPDQIGDLAAMAAEGAFRFANELRASIDIEDGRVVGAHQDGRSHICPTELLLGRERAFQFAPVAFPDLEPDPAIHEDRVVFRRTAGGRTGAPMPRRISRAPYVMITAPTAWTTLELVLHVDGRSEGRLAGASGFPRHWLYGDDGNLVEKSATVDFATWSRENFGEKTPWEGHDQQAFMTQVETAAERELSLHVMRSGTKPKLRRFSTGDLLTKQGDPGRELALVLDGLLAVEVDGKPIAEVGPGALIGERAILEGGVRTATVRALTDGKVAIAEANDLDRGRLAVVATGHRREEP